MPRGQSGLHAAGVPAALFPPLERAGPGVPASKWAASTELEESCTTWGKGHRRVNHLVTIPNEEGFDAPNNDRPRVVRAVCAHVDPQPWTGSGRAPVPPAHHHFGPVQHG